MSQIIHRDAPKSKKRQLIIFSFIVVLLVLAGVGWYFLVYKKNTPQTDVKLDAATIKRDKSMQEVLDIASTASNETLQYVTNKDLAGLENYYVVRIDSYKDDSEVQSRLYIDLSRKLYGNGDPAKVLAFAQKGYELDKEKYFELDSLSLIGYAATKNGNDDLALEFFKKALTKYKEQTYYEYESAFELEAEIAKLEAKS